MDYSKQRFERLFKDSYPQMYRMAFSMVEDADDAKDAVSQVFTQMWKGRPNVSEESLSGYLLAATRNQCLHILRQRQLQQQMEEELRQTAEERLRVGASAGMSSNQEREELLCELQQVINDNLTEQDRRVLQLHYEEEMTYQETATVLGISPSAVNKHITRSLAKIRETLKIAK
jgi:RNA polymerase sigma-70 factor (ECF subfamily)